MYQPAWNTQLIGITFWQVKVKVVWIWILWGQLIMRGPIKMKPPLITDLHFEFLFMLRWHIWYLHVLITNTALIRWDPVAWRELVWGSDSVSDWAQFIHANCRNLCRSPSLCSGCLPLHTHSSVGELTPTTPPPLPWPGRYQWQEREYSWPGWDCGEGKAGVCALAWQLVLCPAGLWT